MSGWLELSAFPCLLAKNQYQIVLAWFVIHETLLGLESSLVVFHVALVYMFFSTKLFCLIIIMLMELYVMVQLKFVSLKINALASL